MTVLGFLQHLLTPLNVSSEDVSAVKQLFMMQDPLGGEVVKVEAEMTEVEMVEIRCKTEFIEEDSKHDIVKYFNKSTTQAVEELAPKTLNMKYSCDQCKYESPRLCELKRHKKCVHEGTKFQCDECGHEVPDIGNLKKHKLANHQEGRKNLCDQCKFESERQHYLTRHKKEVHECVKYQCDECDHKATRKYDLKRHKGIQVRYFCDQCNFTIWYLNTDAPFAQLMKYHRLVIKYRL